MGCLLPQQTLETLLCTRGESKCLFPDFTQQRLLPVSSVFKHSFKRPPLLPPAPPAPPLPWLLCLGDCRYQLRSLRFAVGRFACSSDPSSLPSPLACPASSGLHAANWHTQVYLLSLLEFRFAGLCVYPQCPGIYMVGVQKIVIFPSSFPALFSLKSFCPIEKCEFNQEYTFILERYVP